MHDDASIADMMGRLSRADAIHKLNNDPRKTNGNANAVTDGVGYLTILLHDTAFKSDTESKHAYAASTLHEYSPDRSTCSRGIRGRGRHDKKGKASPPREKSASPKNGRTTHTATAANSNGATKTTTIAPPASTTRSKRDGAHHGHVTRWESSSRTTTNSPPRMMTNGRM